jgi:hypothetical protein
MADSRHRKKWQNFWARVLRNLLVNPNGCPQTIGAQEQVCQMVYFQTKKKQLGKFWRALEWKSLVYFMAVWNLYILWPFDDLVGYFLPFWYYMYQEKSGNPAQESERETHTYVGMYTKKSSLNLGMYLNVSSAVYLLNLQTRKFSKNAVTRFLRTIRYVCIEFHTQ